MTVALAIMYFYDHGVSRSDFRDLALELKRRGHQVVIFSARWKSEMLPDIRQIRVAVKGRDTIAKLHNFERKVNRFRREMNIDCTVAFSRISGADFYYVGEHAVSDVWTERFGLWRFLMPSFYRERRLEKAIYSPSSKTCIWALCDRQIQLVQSLFGTPEARCEVLPIGVSPQVRRQPEDERSALRAALRTKLDIAPDEKICMMSGSDFEGNGVDRAIMALSYLSDQDLRKIRLVVVGKGSVARMDSLARHYNVRNRVVFMEKSANEKHLAAADLVLFPARRGVMSGIPLEAIVNGVPVVVTGKYAFADFLLGRGGIVVEEPFHCRSLTRLLQMLFSQPEKWHTLQLEAEKSDPSEFYGRISRMADRIEESRS